MLLKEGAMLPCFTHLGVFSVFIYLLHVQRFVNMNKMMHVMCDG